MARRGLFRPTALAAVIALLHPLAPAQTAQSHWTLTEIPTLGGSTSRATALDTAVRSITITGPQQATRLRSLVLGGEAGVATLALPVA